MFSFGAIPIRSPSTQSLRPRRRQRARMAAASYIGRPPLPARIPLCSSNRVTSPVFKGRNALFVRVTLGACYRSQTARIVNVYGGCYRVTRFSRGSGKVGVKGGVKPIAPIPLRRPVADADRIRPNVEAGE